MRTNDKGDLVVTKGDQYDVRENTGENEVRKRLFLTPALQNLYGFNLWLLSMESFALMWDGKIQKTIRHQCIINYWI